ncbi:unnamed protein product, partial [Symbiodinium sp. CCMP2456]
ELERAALEAEEAERLLGFDGPYVDRASTEPPMAGAARTLHQEAEESEHDCEAADPVVDPNRRDAVEPGPVAAEMAAEEGSETSSPLSPSSDFGFGPATKD